MASKMKDKTMRDGKHRGGRWRRAVLTTLLAFSVVSLTGAAEKPDAASQDVRQALQSARQQLQKAQQASDQAAKARQQARQALEKTLKAYQASAKQQDATLKQMTALTKALNEYTKALDRLARQQRRPVQRPARQPQPNQPQANEPTQAADQTDAPDQTQQPDASNQDDQTQLAKRDTEATDTPASPEPDDTSTDDASRDQPAGVMEAPDAIANGPIAPQSQAPTALWNDEITEKQMVSKILGAEGAQNSCAKCHTLETQSWKKTAHFKGFEQTHRSDRARQILRNMDQRSMKYRNDTCRKCHYTSTVQRDRIRPVSGVSCESCHGGGQDWVKLHNRIGGDPDARVFEWGADSETTQQRQARLEAARKKGMNHSNMLYAIAANCVKCHTVPDEKLVNEGGHKAGSDFNLVEWSQGEVRHNFLSSPGAPDNPKNVAASQARKRMMYVIGALANLEYTLRNLANVEAKGSKFHQAMIERANELRGRIAQITGTVDVPEVDFALKQVPKGIDVNTTVAAGLADAIQKAGRRFEARHNGADLGALDRLLPAKTKGDPFNAP
jgi:hypothetical protein